MRRVSRIAGALGLTVLIAGCTDFLTGEDLTTDPNRPQDATLDQLLVGVQVNQFIQHTGAMARLFSMWTQQMAGTDRQYIQQALYEITEDDFSDEWNDVYGGGGLRDMRLIQARADSANAPIYRGIARVLEGLTMGMAASIWGDIPYNEAVAGVDAPALTPQLEVYDSVQAVLSAAITDLSTPTGPSPGQFDLIYGGDAARWSALAHTLKARFFLHTAEVNPAAYDSALVHAQLGIADSTGDFKTLHSDAATEANIWHQFFRDRDSYMRAGATLVDTMLARNDPRITNYFAPNQSGAFVGAEEGEPQTAVHSSLSALRLNPGFRQPLVTWSENQLIIAEAAAQTGNTGLAQQALNAHRAAVGLGNIGSSGGQLIHDIMIEKWITLFQNIEAWNDYKRTCVPNLQPAGTATVIPGRIFYAFSERNTNPNIPPPEQQPARNPNDPPNETTPTGAACLGQ
ncbi:MAG TPA: SusD/RagB family nutrient-binding outer membrane lipoprotein [Gemmatimonadaceae bacterium]